MGLNRDAYVHVTDLGPDPLDESGPPSRLPASFTAEVDDPEQPYALDLRVRTLAGRRPEVIELRVELRNPKQPGGITTEGLRGVHVAKALQLALTLAAQAGSADAPARGSSVRPLRGVAVSDEFLARVADIYRAAVAAGSRSPVVEVASQLEGSRPSAGRWVVQARRAGLLKPALGTRAGELVKPASSKAARQLPSLV